MTATQAAALRTCSDRIAPGWFVSSARAVPIGILSQFLLAGLSLFGKASSWEAHATLGLLLALPVVILATIAWRKSEIRALRHWSGVLAGLYVFQVALMADDFLKAVVRGRTEPGHAFDHPPRLVDEPGNRCSVDTCGNRGAQHRSRRARA